MIDLVDEIKAMLLTEGCPIPTSDIVETLEERGFDEKQASGAMALGIHIGLFTLSWVFKLGLS